MKLVDSSVWIDYLRGVDTVATVGVRDMLRAAEPVALTEPVVMELLAGTSDDRALDMLESLTSGLPVLGVEPPLDYRAAATIYRRVRHNGRTVRRLNDCLIAAIALRHDVVLVHKDVDFETIAQFTPLQQMSLR